MTENWQALVKQLIRFLQSLTASKKPLENNLGEVYKHLSPLFKKMSEKQKEGVSIVTKATSHLPLKQRAYILATTYHETAATMQPITEYGGRKYFDKYDTGKLAADLGNTPEADGDGFLYRGRGFVMITGLANYLKAGKKLGKDLVKNPDLALDPLVASDILVRGMTEAWFTKFKLSDFINETKTDYVNARRIVNGLDDAKLIASYALVFEQALLVV